MTVPLTTARWLVACAMFGFISSPAMAAESQVEMFFRQLRAGQPQTVVVYGTSLTEHGPWVKPLREWFDGRYPGKVTLVNSGGSGQNSDWGVQNVQAKVVAKHPDLVFIEFSYNDCVTRFHLTPAHARENLDQIVRAIQKENANAAIILQTMNVPWDAPNGNKSASNRPQLDEFNDVYRACAREQHLTLLDHYPDWVKFRDAEPDKFHAAVPDGTHPNGEGTMAVTWPEIEKFLASAAAVK